MFSGVLCHFLEQRKKFAEEHINLGESKNADDLAAKFTQRIECHADAREIFANFHDEGVELERSLATIEPALSGECGRWREDAIQIAGLLALLEDADRIDISLAQRAVDVVRWCKKSFLALFLKPCFAIITALPSETSTQFRSCTPIDLP
jgi:hypothetical protein